MNNPWKAINLDDYENHMKLDSVRQLQVLNHIMKGQFERYNVSHVMILGVAGGNGLEHVRDAKFKSVYGVDINADYLQECSKRYPELKDKLHLIEADLMDETVKLPHAELVIANLLIEYIGYKAFQNIIKKIKPQYVSCTIQINTDKSFVSASPYLHVFDGLEEVHHQMSITGLNESMLGLKYKLTCQDEMILSNGKRLVRLDYH